MNYNSTPITTREKGGSSGGPVFSLHGCGLVFVVSLWLQVGFREAYCLAEGCSSLLGVWVCLLCGWFVFSFPLPSLASL